MSDSPPAGSPPVPKGPPRGMGPVSQHGLVQKSDAWILVVVCGATLILLGLFGFVIIQHSGLVGFPLHAGRSTPETYFTDALDYRERRIALSLILRTFITGFSFIVGLALATMGGLFILRQVTSLTTWNVAPQQAAAPEAGSGVLGWLKSTQFSFSAYSPGVVFMAGGLLVIVVTQLNAIPVRSPEISPVGDLVCWDDRLDMYRSCRLMSAEKQAADAPAAPEQAAAPAANRVAPPTPPNSFEERCKQAPDPKPLFCIDPKPEDVQ